MSLWLLDDGPFHTLASVFDPAWQWPAGTIHVVREIADGAKVDKAGRRQALLAMQAPDGRLSVTIHDGGPAAAAMLYGHLRINAATADKDLGEDASIALCATEQPQAIFVTMDKRAAYVALAELGRGRVAAPFELWDALEREGRISLDAYRLLCQKTVKTDHGSILPRSHQR